LDRGRHGLRRAGTYIRIYRRKSRGRPQQHADYVIGGALPTAAPTACRRNEMPLPSLTVRSAALMAAFALATAPVLSETVAPRTITVTGEGRAEAVPDMAHVTIGITAEAPTAQEALRHSSEAVTQTLALLDAAGIAPRDRQTSGLSLSPVWDYGRGDRPPRITGYRASNAVAVRLRDLAMLGAVLDGAVAEGANRLEGLSFVLSDPEPVMDEARRRAVADARRKAGLYAQAADVVLGPVQLLAEIGDQPQGRPLGLRAESAMLADASVPVAEGELEFVARVQIVFGIAPDT